MRHQTYINMYVFEYWINLHSIQEFDKDDKGVRCGRILKLKVCILVYTDDSVFIDDEVDNMSTRLTSIADESEEQSNMSVNMPKT